MKRRFPLARAAALSLFAVVSLSPAPAASAPARDGFSPKSVPVSGGRLFDLGVSDFDRDGIFEIFTTNHKFLGTLTEGVPGAWRNQVGPVGFSATPEYPGFEDLINPPTPDSPGLYIWAESRAKGEAGNPEKDPLVHFLARDVTGLPLLAEEARGTVTVPSPKVTVVSSKGATVEISRVGNPVKTRIDFTIAEQGEFVLKVRKVDLPPIEVDIAEAPLAASTYIGAYEARARSRAFTLRLVDRHGIAWADANGDFRTDAFIVRGGLGGGIAQFIGRVDDELLLSTEEGGFSNGIEESGLRKNGCRSRQAAALDFNGDGDLDLFSSCKTSTPKLYRQVRPGSFRPISRQLHLKRAFGSSYRWVDLDGDRLPELLVADKGRLRVLRPGRSADAKWTVDQSVRALNGTFNVQSIAVGDYDRDGDPDLFTGAPQNNTLFVNERGSLRPVSPGRVGLPRQGLGASWVDFDNDGLLDLHSLPSGLYRQMPSGNFRKTGFAAGASKALWAIGSWFDANADGYRDLVYANRLTGGDPKVITRLLVNNRGGNHWLAVDLRGREGNAEAIGARVRIQSGGETQTGWVGQSDGSRYSQGHYRVYFGLGRAGSVDQLTVVWPDGARTEISDVAADRVLELSR